VLLYCAGFAAGLEFLQLFVHSRVSDVTDVLVATLGCAVGILLARVFGDAEDLRVDPVAHAGRTAIGRTWLWAAAYAVFVLAALWFPYDFRFDPAFVRERYVMLWAVPLEKLYFQSEFRAASTLVLKAGLFVPLGILLAMGISRVSRERRSLAAWGSAIFVVLLALVGELGQVFLPGKYPDLSDVMLATGGAFFAALLVLGPGNLARTLVIPRRAPRASVAVGIAYVSLLALIWVVTHWPGAPYNVRELLRPGIPLLSAALLAAAIVWLCAFPTLAAWSIRGRDAARAMVRWPVVLVSHAALAYVLLALAVPEESIGDIVGSPVLGGPRQLEYLVRSTVLYATIVWLLFLGGLTAWRRRDYIGTHAQLIAVSVVVSVFLLPIAHWVIVVQAATDNLVELMHDGGGIPASAALACFLVLLGATGGWIARILQSGAFLAPLKAAALAAISTLAGYGLLMLGTEQTLFKYGKVFSSLQFLLSVDRNHYLIGPSLLLRFAATYAGAITILVLSYWSVVSQRTQTDVALVSPQRAGALLRAPRVSTWRSPGPRVRN
jgi:glycopeptide antibiotics resistance protein